MTEVDLMPTSPVMQQRYLAQVDTLLQQLIHTVNQFDNEHHTIQQLSTKEEGKRYRDYLSQLCLIRTVKLNQSIRQQAEQLRLTLEPFRHGGSIWLDPETVDLLTLDSHDHRSEKRHNIETLLTHYASDLQKTPEVYHRRLVFDYQPTMASALSSPAFNHNIELLRQHGLVNPLNEATLIGSQSFDFRQLLTFDDYRLYLLQYYFKVLRADVDADQHDQRPEAPHLTPFELLFNPHLEIRYSPEVLALLHFQHRQQVEPISTFVLQFKQQTHRLLNESGELIRQLEARIRALQQTLANVKQQQQTIDTSLKKSPIHRVASPKASPKSGKKHFRGEEYHYHQRNTKIQEEINALKRERSLIANNTKLLNDYDRIAQLYIKVETQFLNDLSTYLLAKKQDPTTQASNDLRHTIFQNHLTIKENHHQFRATEKQSSPHFRDKPFERQNNRYINYRKLWLDIIDNMFAKPLS